MTKDPASPIGGCHADRAADRSVHVVAHPTQGWCRQKVIYIHL
ncbi:MAG: hypothetical protein AAED33_09230 [Paracoccaceae bacterium]